MKYTFRNKFDHSNPRDSRDLLTIGVSYSKEKFRFKPAWVSHLENLHSMKYKDGGYTSAAYFVPTTFQFFWLKFCFYIISHKQELSDGNRYINIESSYEYVLKKKNIEEQNFLNKPTNFFKYMDYYSFHVLRQYITICRNILLIVFHFQNI